MRILNRIALCKYIDSHTNLDFYDKCMCAKYGNYCKCPLSFSTWQTQFIDWSWPSFSSSPFSITRSQTAVDDTQRLLAMQEMEILRMEIQRKQRNRSDRELFMAAINDVKRKVYEYS